MILEFLKSVHSVCYEARVISNGFEVPTCELPSNAFYTKDHKKDEWTFVDPKSSHWTIYDYIKLNN